MPPRQYKIRSGVTMNRLGQATSPYLQQHAQNPVDWWEWSPQAFEVAAQREVPVFLSVGYAACHWCHVMAHESFEDPKIAKILNDGFVSIKVDREERPDVDALYMRATQALTGQGGWPMTVFLDTAGRPFYAGTYFPPEPRHGLPSFEQLLGGLSRVWKDEPERVTSTAASLTEAISRHAATAIPEPSAPDPEMSPTEVLDTAINAGAMTLRDQYDSRNAGFGGVPKFPPGMALEFLLRYEALTGEHWALVMVQETCHRMARGGMYDQLGGGFARYSVDAEWIVPHFEKMLYDNAQLLRLYAHLWRATGDALALRVATETANFLRSKLLTAEGGFASALDADSDTVIAGVGREGAFYVWEESTLAEVLDPVDSKWLQDLCAVGNPHTFESVSSVLQLQADPSDWDRWLRIRAMLADARERRPRPARDDKIVAAWNGLAITALVEAGKILDRPEWIQTAITCGELLHTTHVSGTGSETTLARVSRDGSVGAPPGVLEDYGAVANAFLALYQATGVDHWQTRANDLLDAALIRFRTDGHFVDADRAADQLVASITDISDNAYPSGTSSILEALVTATLLTQRSDYGHAVDLCMRELAPTIGERARFSGWTLAVIAAQLDGPVEVKVSGGTRAERRIMQRTAYLSTRPGLVVTVAQQPGSQPETSPASAQVCKENICELPTNDRAELAQALGVRVDLPSAVDTSEPDNRYALD
jgi:uncharacterized protein YyaL (SSP411 family)